MFIHSRPSMADTNQPIVYSRSVKTKELVAGARKKNSFDVCPQVAWWCKVTQQPGGGGGGGVRTNPSNPPPPPPPPGSAPVSNTNTSRPDICQRLVVQTLMDNMRRKKPITQMTHVVCKSKLHSVVRSSMHAYPEEKIVSILHACVYYGPSTLAFSAEMKCCHCTT